VTQFDDADLTRINELRQKHAAAYEAGGARLTVTVFIMSAVASVLRKHPLFNASLDETGQNIVYKEYVHLGLAVDTEAGLLVPVLRDVDTKSMVQLSKELQELADKARERKLGLEDMKGGTFTISNQGGIGSGHFTPIINRPEVAILGLGRSVPKPVARDSQIVSRVMLPLGLSYDHRLIDGANAARFMVDLVKAIEGFSEEGLKQ
jgi:pyruvate dehydrogenase E2 component (dihydrolipoamide acetyltransferase)